MHRDRVKRSQTELVFGWGDRESKSREMTQLLPFWFWAAVIMCTRNVDDFA
jgi:hypothetical protein